MKNDNINENKITKTRNTDKTLQYYEDLVDFFDNDSSTSLLKMRSFSLYTPRQVQSDYLVKYELMKKIMDVHGSIAEFGVFNGQGLMTLANISSILEPNNLNRKIFGFDTFEGFSGVSENDKSMDNTHVKEGGYYCNSYERIQKSINLYDENRFLGHVNKVKLVKGDIRKTLDVFLDENPHVVFSLVYFDMDIYEPTKYTLEKIISRIPKNGIIAFDEVNHESFPGETVALLETFDLRNIELKRLPFCSRISYIQL